MEYTLNKTLFVIFPNLTFLKNPYFILIHLVFSLFTYHLNRYTFHGLGLSCVSPSSTPVNFLLLFLRPIMFYRLEFVPPFKQLQITYETYKMYMGMKQQNIRGLFKKYRKFWISAGYVYSIFDFLWRCVGTHIPHLCRQVRPFWMFN